jgi:GT2 family glycosyltransferase
MNATAGLLPISVLLVSWDSATVLPASLAALAASDPLPNELVVVDNASRDQSVALIERFAATAPFTVQLLRSGRNVGFAAGMNRAIADSSAPFVFLHNPDLRLLPDTLARLYARMAESDDGVYAVGPKLRRALGHDLSASGVLDSTGIRMTRDGRHFDRGAGEPDDGRYDRPEEVFGITGAAVLLRRSALDAGRVDGQVFDEDFFAYREDVDLAWRMRGFGYRALYEPSALAYHLRRVTPERRRSLSASVNRHSVKNRFLLRIHHADRGWLAEFGLRSLARDLVVVGACLTVEWSSLPAFPWLLRHGGTHLARRRSILARRHVTSRELRRWFR